MFGVENIAGILDKSVNKKKISCESIRGKANTVVESYSFLEQNRRPKLSFALKTSDFNYLLLLLLLFEVRGSLRPVWMRQLVGAEPRGPISCHGNGSSP